MHQLVLRRWARPGWDVEDPDFNPAHEAVVLGLLADSPVPAPEVVAVDPDGERCDTPALLLTLLPGAPPPEEQPRDVARFAAELASALPLIHGVDPRGVVRNFSRYYEPGRVTVPEWSRRPEVWVRAIEVAAAPPPAAPAVFIHRDYHPENTLWSRGRMTGVVDWTAASVGPAAVDVGHMRWNLAATYSIEVANEFLKVYCAGVGDPARDQPYWDVVTAVDVLPELGPDGESDEELLRVEEHVAAALARAI